MKMWLEPKTNWTANDKINVNDFNRIRNNIEHIINLKQLADDYYIQNFQLETVKTVTDMPYCEIWNNLENALDSMNSKQPLSDFGKTKNYKVYDNYIDWKELNRLETLCLEFKKFFLENNVFIKEKLSFELGNYGGVRI